MKLMKAPELELGEAVVVTIETPDGRRYRTVGTFESADIHQDLYDVTEWGGIERRYYRRIPVSR